MTTPRYRHVGTQPIVVGDVEVQPGAEFSAELTAEQRDFFVSIGAIEAIPDPPPVAEPSPAGRRARRDESDGGA